MTDVELYPRYPHLENLDRVPQVLDAPYLDITEKIHGFNARFGRTPDGTFWVGSRNQVVDPKDRLQGFTDFAMGHNRIVPHGWTLYGEWAGKGIQKGIDYGTPAFYLFAIRNEYGELMHPEAVEDFAVAYSLRQPPAIHIGTNPGIEKLDAWRQEESLLAGRGQIREGIVIVPWPPVYDDYGHQLIAKYKAPSFSERAHARREQPAPADFTNVQAFVDDYVTGERLDHVVALVEEDLKMGVALGLLRLEDADPLAPLNTGRVLRGMVEDIKREGRDDLAKLNENELKALGKVSNAATKVLLDDLRQSALRPAA